MLSSKDMGRKALDQKKDLYRCCEKEKQNQKEGNTKPGGGRDNKWYQGIKSSKKKAQ